MRYNPVRELVGFVLSHEHFTFWLAPARCVLRTLHSRSTLIENDPWILETAFAFHVNIQVGIWSSTFAPVAIVRICFFIKALIGLGICVDWCLNSPLEAIHDPRQVPVPTERDGNCSRRQKCRDKDLRVYLSSREILPIPSRTSFSRLSST